MAASSMFRREGEAHQSPGTPWLAPAEDSLVVLSVRHVGAYQLVSAAWEALMGIAYKHRLINKDSELFGIVYDDPNAVPDRQSRYDACLSLSPDTPIDPMSLLTQRLEVRARLIHLDLGAAWAILHQGPLDSLWKSYQRLFSSAPMELDAPPVIECYGPASQAGYNERVILRAPIKQN